MEKLTKAAQKKAPKPKRPKSTEYQGFDKPIVYAESGKASPRSKEMNEEVKYIPSMNATYGKSSARSKEMNEEVRELPTRTANFGYEAKEYDKHHHTEHNLPMRLPRMKPAKGV